MSRYVPPHRRRQQEGGEEAPATQSPARTTEQGTIAEITRCAYCINLDHRTDKWDKLVRSARRAGLECSEKSGILHRFSAVQGRDTSNEDVQMTWESEMDSYYNAKQIPGPKQMTPGEAGCALSHVSLWRKLLASDHPHMLILEDDCQFATYQGRDRFARSFIKVWKDLPSDWGMFYLGFSSRGERQYVVQHDPSSSSRLDPEIDVYQPSYGYHTHAYMLTRVAAQTLLDHLPVTGPIDVFLADNRWFDIPTYCAVIAQEGWKRDGKYEGKNLIQQDRSRNFQSDVTPK